MLDNVVLLGLVKDMTFQDGNKHVLNDDPRNPIVAFQFQGWDPNGTPEGAQDEQLGHLVARAMESVGRALADGKLTPAEAANILAVSNPAYQNAKVLEAVITVGEDVFRAFANDGRLSWAEALSLTSKLFEKFAR